ncbi:homoserine kinase [Brevundimonas goettingensis]|uniref:Homoserine kinase n=1 Tax=Brevundimonas goettingensis TaxID=2774190 RepID=A0A975C0F1_9CAUL|nr:homoserine kinase [Brevundimonas goettingensis]QTC91453.1 homoserine kinase [Brevundimonas goettingensis]
MAVFTPVSDDQARAFVGGYPAAGEFVSLHAIAEGVENTNYRLETTSGRFVLTLFEGRTDAASLPFCLGLTDHLGAAGYPAARPLRDRNGQWIGELNGRPAAVVEWLSGAWLREPSPDEVARAGAALARFHLSARRFAGRRANPVGPLVWKVLLDRSASGAATAEDRQLVADCRQALERIGDPFTDDLPSGAIHADYFPDNVLFEGGQVSGVIDVYFGCDGPFAYDLAIALTAWGFDGEGHEIPGAVEAFRRGYESVRLLTWTEEKALPLLGEAAALRFTLTRLHDRIFHDPTKLVTPKDPAAFFRRTAYWRVTEAA